MGQEQNVARGWSLGLKTKRPWKDTGRKEIAAPCQELAHTLFSQIYWKSV
jgi:hypothetical protein